jgi:hypothetical protein
MMPDRFVESVLTKYKARSEAGLRKYGTTLEREDLSFVDWLNHLQEELMDATLYIERVMKDVQDQAEERQSAKVVEHTVRQLREGSWGSAPLHRAEDAGKPTPPKANFSGVCGDYIWFVDSKGEVTYLKLPE